MCHFINKNTYIWYACHSHDYMIQDTNIAYYYAMYCINKPTNNKHIALFRAATSWNIPPSLPHCVLSDFPLFTFWDIFLAPSFPPSLCPHQGTSPTLYLCTSCNLSLSLSLSTSRNVSRSLFMYIMQPLPSSHYLSLHIMEHLSRSIYLPFLSLSRAMILSLGSASAGRERYSYSACEHCLWPIKSISQEKEEVFMSSGDRLY